MAPLLAERLGCSWADLDDRIARAAGAPVPELLRRTGEAAFRAAEEAALREALGDGETRPPGLVLACGGGVVAREPSRALLRRRAFVVWLRVTPGTAAARLGPAGAAARPLLDGAGPLAGRIESLLLDRALLYGAAAHAEVETDGRTPGEVAEEIRRIVCAGGGPWASSGS